MAKKHSIAQAKYDSTHCKFYNLKLNLVTDSDLIAKLAEQESKQGYIKDLIRTDISKKPKLYPPTRYSEALYGCGSCGHELAPGKPKYCYECGQAVQWDDVRTCSVPKTENKSMEEKKMTVRELAQNWIDNADTTPVPEIDIETAEQYISWMDPDTDLPEGLTAESFMKAWNDIIRT